MKTFARTLNLFLFLSAVMGLTLLSACKGDDPKPLTEAEKVTKLLTEGTATWTPPTSGGVLIDGTDVTQDLFEGFTITFGEGTLQTTGETPVWLRTDTWSFKDESATVIIRGQDQKEITINNISATQLTLTLEWDQTTTEGGRSKSLAGTHVFTLTK